MVTNLNLSSESRRRTIFVLTVMTFGIVLLIIFSILKKGWITGAIWSYGLSAVFLLYALMAKDDILKRLFIFSITAGFAELLADYWLVAYTKTLIYPQDEPILVSSPAYMPFSWTVVLMEVGYIGWLLSYRWNMLRASIFLCFLGALIVPLYENWAIHAGWWYYVNTPKVFHVPRYVIAAEGLLMLSVPLMLREAENSKRFVIVLWGLVEGVVMFVACLISFFLFG